MDTQANAAGLRVTRFLKPHEGLEDALQVGRRNKDQTAGKDSRPTNSADHYGKLEDPPADNRGLQLKNLGDTYERVQTYEFVLDLVDPG